MLKFYEQRRWWTIIYSPVVGLILLALVIVLGPKVYERYLIEREMASRRLDAEQHLEELKIRHNGLSEKVKYLSHQRGIEAEVRRNFDMATEGEKVVIILEDENSPVIQPLPTTLPIPVTPWYRFWE